MSGQGAAAAAIVMAAIGYLAWKVGLGGRKRPARRGPDVPVSKLVRRPPKR